MLENLYDKKIISSISDDFCKYWVNNLANDLLSVHTSNSYSLFYSANYNFYLLNIDTNKISFVTELIESLIEKNYVHFIISDFSNYNDYINFFEHSNLKNFDYSILNYYGEITYDSEPYDIKNLKKLKYFFSSTNLLSLNNKFGSEFNNNCKFILDYKYSLTYFYYKCGFCFFQKGEHIFENCSKINKVFMYTKYKDQNRKELIDMALRSNKIYEKNFTFKDEFWFRHNNVSLHTSFIIDYNICYFNIIHETNPINYIGDQQLSIFISEKTLKSFFVTSPSYVLLQKEIHNDLKNYGFYFLNQEFDGDEMDNYNNFCDFLKNCNETEFEKLFISSKGKNKKNKVLLENYIFSDKVRELDLILNCN